MLANLRPALVVTRREIRDQFRDWRILAPIVVLTLFFPGLMNFVADRVVDFMQTYETPLIGDRLVPFLLMVVGFFPISVSLVIALESFVGEKERRSIEPLLSSPLTDFQLYIGKLLAVMVPPLLASFMGIAVYLLGVYRQLGWQPEPILLIHGQADNNSGTFPIQSERFYNAIKGQGGTARLVMLPLESHGYRSRGSIMHMLWEMTNWLDRYVKNK